MVSREQRGTQLSFSLFYFLVFFGFGALFPLLSVYLKDNVGLTGSQIGMIMSINPIVMLFAQPLWGMLSDTTRKPTAVLTAALIGTGITGIIFSMGESFSFFVSIAILLAFFQSAIVPVSDSISMSYVQRTNTAYGSLRLWGAIGFAVSVLVVGKLSETFQLTVIFYAFTFVLLAGAIVAARLPRDNESLKVSLKDGFRELGKLPSYLLFLVVTFLVLGPILANNIYFGLFIDEIGGGLAGIGIAFLFATGSEAPFMKFASSWITRLGMKRILLMAVFISAARWFLYFLEPPLAVVYATTFAQGFSVGLFIPAALLHVKNTAPAEVGATAISIYSAAGNGLGNWFCTFFGGIIMEALSILHVYLFFGCMTLLAFLILCFIRIDSRAAAS